MIKNILFTALLFFASAHAICQRHYFVQYSVKEGLAQSQVRDIVQTKDGFLWIATVGGISRFDGNEFLTYNKSNGLPNNLVTCLFESRNNDLWAACKGNLVVFSKNGIKTIFLGDRYAETLINDIIEFRGKIYLGTNGNGILVLSEGNIEVIDLGDEEKNFIRAFNTKENELLIGTKSGLLSLGDKNYHVLIDSISVSSIYGEENKIWLTTYGQGLFYIEENEIKIYTEKDGLLSNNQREICVDKNGHPWIIYKNGIEKYDLTKRQFRALKSFDPQHTTNLKTVYKDREGNIWIGTDGFGVLKYTGDKIEIYTISDGLASEIVMGIEETESHDLYFATYGRGIIKKDFRSQKFTSIETGLLNLTAWSLLSLDSNELLVGTSNGINRIKNDEVSDFEWNDSLPWPRASTMFLDSEKKLWIGTRDGILVIKNNQVFKLPETLKQNVKEVKSFTEYGGKLWIASNSGLFQYDQKTNLVQQFCTKDQTLPEDYIFCIDHDQKGNIWLGSENGIIVFNPKSKTYRQISLSHQVSSNIVNFVLNDNERYLWIGTDNGLFYIDLQLYLLKDSILITKLNEHNGIVSQECNQNAVFLDSKNQIWFGTNGGLIKLNQGEDVNSSGSIQNIHINDVLINFESVFDKLNINNGNDYVKFNYNTNRVSFRFSAIYHSNPEKISYSYRLEGSDDSWSPATRENYVTYASLSPGRYTFQVRAKLENTEWNESYAAFSFEIETPFWRKWWFILSMLLITATIIYAIVLQIQRIETSKKQFEEIQLKAKMLGLEQQTLNAHMNRHFIFNALNSIQYYINTQERKMANLYLSNFASLVRKNLDSAQQESIYLMEELDRLKLYMNLEQMRFKDRFEYRIDIDEELEIDGILVPSMILQPFVENSIMHGILPSKLKGLIEISIYGRNNDLIFKIRDNGIGIDTSMHSKENSTSHHVSNGMKITKQRMELLQKIHAGNYAVEGPKQISKHSNQENGTLVIITIPLQYR